MNMKITRLARGVKCGGLAARKLVSEAAARVQRSARATSPKPQEAVLSIWRRDRKRLRRLVSIIVSSIDVPKFSRSKQRLAETGPGGQMRVPLVSRLLQRLAVITQIAGDA